MVQVDNSVSMKNNLDHPQRGLITTNYFSLESVLKCHSRLTPQFSEKVNLEFLSHIIVKQCPPNGESLHI